MDDRRIRRHLSQLSLVVGDRGGVIGWGRGRGVGGWKGVLVGVARRGCVGGWEGWGDTCWLGGGFDQ